MNQKIMKYIQVANSFWNMPAFVVMFAINTITLLMKFTGHKDIATKLDLVECGTVLVFLMELHVAYRKPKKENKKVIEGHMATCRYPETCKCAGEY